MLWNFAAILLNMYEDLIESLNNRKTDSQKNKKIEVLGNWLGHTAIQNNLNKMQDINIIKRIGSRKNGYWEVLKWLNGLIIMD